MFLIPRSVSLYFTQFPHLCVDIFGNVFDKLNHCYLPDNPHDHTVRYNVPGENKRYTWSYKWLVRRAYYSLYDEYDEDDVASLKFVNCSKYIITCDGRCFNTVTWDIMKPKKDYSGYLRYVLQDDHGEKKTFLAHRLVAEAFIPNPKKYEVVNHKDLNPSNCHVSNLEWCTQAANVRHAVAYGHHPSAKPMTSIFFG